MNPQELKKLVEAADIALFSKKGVHLSDVQKFVLEHSCQNQTYEEMAANSEHLYSYTYLRQDVGPQLWQLLSEVLGERVSKTNFQAALERCSSQLGVNLPQFNELSVEETILIASESNEQYPVSSATLNIDWGEAVDVSTFCGRDEELSTLMEWILNEHCRLVAVLAMGGMGKTSLSFKLAQQIQSEFEYVIWRSLKNAPPLKEIITDIIKFLSNQKRIDLPEDMSRCISLLINDYLQKHRCLLILDNMDSILKDADHAGLYKKGYEEYGDLLTRVGSTPHLSCLLLTSRENLNEIALLEGRNSPVRTFKLIGLNELYGSAIFQEKSKFKGAFYGNGNDYKRIIEHYAGNPLALNIAATGILEVFNGNLSTFIAEYLELGYVTFHKIRELLDRHFNPLPDFQKEIMYWLAVNREPLSISELKKDLVSLQHQKKLPDDLTDLRWRSLVETNNSGLFTQQPVVMEYITERLIEQVCQEIETGQISLLNKIALSKAQNKDYIRESQFNLILEPIQQNLSKVFRGKENLEGRFKEILSHLRITPLEDRGYASGNIINLLRQMRIDLSNYNFSDLSIWQAHLPGVNLHGVNFTNSDLSKSVFTETLGSIWAVTFSPNGNCLATGDSFNKIRLWQVPDYKLEQTLEGHTNWIQALAFSPNGQILASGSGDQTVKLWDIQTGQCLKTLEGHTDWLGTVAFSPDGQILASGSGDRTVKLWRVTTGELVTTLQKHSARVRAIAFSPDGTILASASEDKTVKLWNVEKAECFNTLAEHTNTVRSVAFSPDGKILASGSDDYFVKKWNVTTGQCIDTLKGHTDAVRTISFSPDGQILASGGLDSVIRLWEITTGQLINYLKGHDNAIRSLVFSPDGQTIASGSDDNNVRLWNCSTAKCLRILQGYSRFIYAVAFSPDGRTLVSASEDKTLSLWDTSASDGVSLLKTFPGHTHWVWSVAFSPDGKKLVSCSEDRTVRLWNVINTQCLKVLEGHTSWVQSVAFSPDGLTVASCSYDQTVRIWDISTDECHILKGHTSWVQSVAYSPDGQKLVSCSDDKTVRVWDLKTNQCILILEGHTNWIWSVAFSSDGETIASAGADKTIILWNINSGHYSTILNAHTNGVRSVAFSPDGRILASGSDDKTVKLWDVSTGRCLDTLAEHTNAIRSVAFNPNNKILASGSEDEKIKFWDIHTGECIFTTGIPLPYESMNITGVKGLTGAQKSTLKALGAVEDEE